MSTLGTSRIVAGRYLFMMRQRIILAVVLLLFAAAVAALFFAVHPLRVEHVAWATPRDGLVAACCRLREDLLQAHTILGLQHGGLW